MDSVAYREQLYDIFGDPSEDVDSKIGRALELGREYLELSIGFLTRIDTVADRQEILYATGEHPLIQPGESCRLDQAYCRRTVEIEGTLAVADASASTAVSDTAFETFNLGTYIGAKMTVDGTTYGTVCFADESERDEGFTDIERIFVELIAGLAGQTFERRDYERELSEREAKLDEQQAIYRAVIDANFDYIFRLDREGQFTYCSESVTEFLGYTPAELEGRLITVVHPDIETTKRAWDLLERLLDGEAVQTNNFPIETKSGQIEYTDIRATPIYDGSVPESERTPEDIVEVQGMARDASERRQREGLISVINRVLRHNLRNEMNVIGGYAEMLETELDAELAQKAAIIRATADRLLDLSESAQHIEKNRDFPVELEPFDIVPVVERVTTQLQTRYPDVSIRVETPESAVVESLPRIEIALYELLDNAAKYGDDSPTVEIEETADGSQILIRIADSGPGLPDTEWEVLESGVETPLVHGKGLGLWLVYWMVTTLEGELEATTSEQGTTIEIRLPKCPEESHD